MDSLRTIAPDDLLKSFPALEELEALEKNLAGDEADWVKFEASFNAAQQAQQDFWGKVMRDMSPRANSYSPASLSPRRGSLPTAASLSEERASSPLGFCEVVAATSPLAPRNAVRAISQSSPQSRQVSSPRSQRQGNSSPLLQRCLKTSPRGTHRPLRISS
tara:strand:+ start:5565 stop:6047 length:483 start_codon:yes stop_codon:yes gene_type:complete